MFDHFPNRVDSGWSDNLSSNALFAMDHVFRVAVDHLEGRLEERAAIRKASRGKELLEALHAFVGDWGNMGLRKTVNFNRALERLWDTCSTFDFTPHELLYDDVIDRIEIKCKRELRRQKRRQQ